MSAHAGPSANRFLPAELLSVGAVFTTWVLPGAGHWMLGHTVRGLVLLVCIVGLWTMGLLVGGIGVIDHRHPIDEEFIQARSQPERRRSFWFFGQALVAPSLVVHQVHLQRQPPILPPPEGIDRDPNQARFVQPTFAHPFELGQLFTTVAGMLNLLAMIDLLWRVPAGQGPSSGGVRKRPRSSIPPPELPPEVPPELPPEASPGSTPVSPSERPQRVGQASAWETSPAAAPEVQTPPKASDQGETQSATKPSQVDGSIDDPSAKDGGSASNPQSATDTKQPSTDAAETDTQADQKGRLPE